MTVHGEHFESWLPDAELRLLVGGTRTEFERISGRKLRFVSPASTNAGNLSIEVSGCESESFTTLSLTHTGKSLYEYLRLLICLTIEHATFFRSLTDFDSLSAQCCLHDSAFIFVCLYTYLVSGS